jgi:hypothetical protein
MYLRAYIITTKRGRSEVIGAYKAILELADTIKTEIEQKSDMDETCDLNIMTEKQLRRCITKDLHGGSISFKTHGLLDGEVPQKKDAWRFRTLLKNNFWCLIVIIPIGLALIVAARSIPEVRVLVAIPFLAIFVIYVGKSRKSTAVLFWSPMLLILVGQLIIANVL